MNIRQNQCVEGIDVRLYSCTKSIKICQLVDDNTIFVKNIQSAKEAIKVVENFGKVSGTKLNKSETEVPWSGDNFSPQRFFDDIPWKYGPFKALGICFSKTSLEINKLNWEDKIGKPKRILDKKKFDLLL